MNKVSQNGRKWICRFHEALFAFNIAFAVVCPLIAFGFREFETKYAPAPRITIKYFFLKGAVRINSLLHLAPDTVVGQELAFTLTLVGLALLLLLAVAFLRGTGAYSRLLNPVAGVTACLALPAASLCVAAKVSAVLPFASGPVSFRDPLVAILAVEVLSVVALSLIARKRPLSTFVYGILLLLHYAFWIAVLSSALPAVKMHSPIFFSIVFPGSGVAWLLYIRESRNKPTQPPLGRIRWGGGVVLAASSCLALLVVWIPGRNVSIVHPRSMEALTISMARKGCYGSCPVYTVTIHGSGSIDYSGIHHVRAYGHETGSISESQLAKLLHGFDQIGFFTLEDRAFDRCFDTPIVSISISVDGQQKSVSSDTFCLGPQSGPQAEFVALAQQIDRTVGTDRWTRCNGRCSAE